MTLGYVSVGLERKEKPDLSELPRLKRLARIALFRKQGSKDVVTEKSPDFDKGKGRPPDALGCVIVGSDMMVDDDDRNFRSILQVNSKFKRIADDIDEVLR